MKRFAQLFRELDETNKTNDKVAALARYFDEAPAADCAWAVYFLSGRKLRQLVPIRRLCQWAVGLSNLAEWMFEECYETVGDLAETIALILPTPIERSDMRLAEWVVGRLLPLRDADETTQQKAVGSYWQELDPSERFVFNKIITGAFRVGVSQRLVLRGLSSSSGIDGDVLAHRLMGSWEPSEFFFRQLIQPSEGEVLSSQPYPFLLAHPLESTPNSLGHVRDWQAEWKWDGIRAQLIRRKGETHIWSRGEELVTERFPELAIAAERLPEDSVLDGEILAWKDNILPFAILQKRIGRKSPGKKILADVPVVFMMFDLLETSGTDLRPQPLRERRQQLDALANAMAQRTPNDDARFLISEVVTASDWEELMAIRQTGRARHTEGLMLKRLDSAYGVGRPRGDWWKWKIEPLSVDAVLIYAQRGSGRRASLYTDYTFAVWDGEQLVPFAKAYSGLSDDEIRQVDRFVREHTVESFGPVRSVQPRLVFEIAFDSIQESKRHKSGIAVRFPRIARWRTDKAPEDADTLERARRLIAAY